MESGIAYSVGGLQLAATLTVAYFDVYLVQWGRGWMIAAGLQEKLVDHSGRRRN